MCYRAICLGLMLCGCALSDMYRGEYERDRFFKHIERLPVEDVNDDYPPSIECDGVSHSLAEVLARIGDIVKSRILREYSPNHWMRHESTITHLLEAPGVDWIGRVRVEARGRTETYDTIILSYFDTYPDHPKVDNVVGARSGVDVVIIPCRWEVVDVYDWDAAGEE